MLDSLDGNLPWVLVGDFNCILLADELSPSLGASSSFRTWVDRNALIDLGYVGTRFTWSHGHSVSKRRAARLDRALCCDQWRRDFPATIVHHLSHGYSDHCPLLLDLSGAGDDRLGERPFRFMASWMLHKDYFWWMEKEWEWNGDLMSSLECFAEKLRCWNRDTFGNVFSKKRRVQRRLEGVVRALDVQATPGLLSLERELKREWSDILLQEELLWLQKSRIDWLKLGDKNTKFLHTSTLLRRRRNKIAMLQKEDGEWVSDKQELNDLAAERHGC